MNSDELQNFVDYYPCLKNYVGGVYAINTLPQYVTSYPSFYIVNTDPIPLPGRHWILIIIHSPWKVDYFDSIGHGPGYYGFHRFIERNSSNVIFKEKQLQSFKSDVCGLYVLFVLIMILCNHYSLNDVYSFFTNDVYQNDRIVQSYMSRYFQ